jgi:hypothetical protein
MNLEQIKGLLVKIHFYFVVSVELVNAFGHTSTFRQTVTLSVLAENSLAFGDGYDTQLLAEEFQDKGLVLAGRDLWVVASCLEEGVFFDHQRAACDAWIPDENNVLREQASGIFIGKHLAINKLVQPGN